jgi:hypothetical protein
LGAKVHLVNFFVYSADALKGEFAMVEDFDWEKFEEDEVERILSEVEAIEQSLPQGVATCPNYSGEATVEAFVKAMDASIDIFAEKTKSLWL